MLKPEQTYANFLNCKTHGNSETKLGVNSVYVVVIILIVGAASLVIISVPQMPKSSGLPNTPSTLCLDFVTLEKMLIKFPLDESKAYALAEHSQQFKDVTNGYLIKSKEVQGDWGFNTYSCLLVKPVIIGVGYLLSNSTSSHEVIFWETSDLNNVTNVDIEPVGAFGYFSDKK